MESSCQERTTCVTPYLPASDSSAPSCVTWNASPRDPKGQIGAYEAALMNTKMAIPEQPLEILRTLHSFDPCLACSTHVLGDDGSELISVQVC